MTTRIGTPYGGRARGMRIAAVACVVAVWVSGCAPAPVTLPRLDQDQVRERFERALSRRAGPSLRFDTEAVVWVSLGDGDLPGVQARVLLASPDSMRLRLQSAFGTAIDLVARGDSMTAWVPAAKIATALDARADSLGVRLPGSLGYRLWSAAWDPPARAWAGVERADSLLHLAWADEIGQWTLDVGRSGLPAAVSLEAQAGKIWRARYPVWSSGVGGAWPAQVEVDAPGDMKMSAKLQRTRVNPAGGGRFDLRVPASTRYVDREEVMVWLERIVEKVGGR